MGSIKTPFSVLENKEIRSSALSQRFGDTFEFFCGEHHYARNIELFFAPQQGVLLPESEDKAREASEQELFRFGLLDILVFPLLVYKLFALLGIAMINTSAEVFGSAFDDASDDENQNAVMGYCTCCFPLMILLAAFFLVLMIAGLALVLPELLIAGTRVVVSFVLTAALSPVILLIHAVSQMCYTESQRPLIGGASDDEQHQIRGDGMGLFGDAGDDSVVLNPLEEDESDAHTKKNQ